MAKPGRKPTRSIGEIRRALIAADGYVSIAAKNLGMHYTAMCKRMTKYPALKELVISLRATRQLKIVESAEKVMFNKIEEGNWAATEKAIDVLGHKIGYKKPVIKVRKRLDVLHALKMLDDDASDQLADAIRQVLSDNQKRSAESDGLRDAGESLPLGPGSAFATQGLLAAPDSNGQVQSPDYQ